MVADEVRALALKTQDATSDINNILDKIVGSISETAESMESNKQKASTSVELAGKTVDSLEAIRGSVISLSSENENLATLAQSLTEDLSAVRESVGQIDSASQEVAGSTGETRSAADMLASTSDQLGGVVGRFKT